MTSRRYDRDLREVKPRTNTDALRFEDLPLKELNKINEKVTKVAEAVEALEAQKETQRLSKLREHVRNYVYKPESPPRATHFRDRSCDPFFEMAITEAEERRRRRGH
jgi:hypothetical protein